LYVIITGWYLYTVYSRTTTSEGFTTVYHGPQYGLLYPMYVLIYFINVFIFTSIMFNPLIGPNHCLILLKVLLHLLMRSILSVLHMWCM